MAQVRQVQQNYGDIFRQPMTEKIQQAIELHRKGNLAQAEAIYNEVLRLAPDHPDALHMLGIMHAQTGRKERALALMLKSVQAAPSRRDYLFNLATAYNDLNRPYEALDVFRKYSEFVPDNVEAIYAIARILHDRGDLDQAIEYYHRALDLFPQRLATLNSLGLAYSEKNSLEKAVFFYEQALVLNRRDLVVLVNLGQAHIKLGNYDQAAELFRQALEVDQDNVSASFYLGFAQLNTKMYQEAEVNFRKAISSKQDFSEAYHDLGLALHKQGRLDEAETAFAKEILLEPDFPEGYYWFGVVLSETGKYDAAASSFRQALICRPDYREARVCLAIVAWIQGDFNSCEKYCRIDNADSAGSEEEKKYILPYKTFLNSLLGYAAQQPEQYRHGEKLPPLYAIGDSHCLAVAHITVCYQGSDYLVKPVLVIGAKAWHFGNSVRNEFKESFEKKVDSIPFKSTALVMFGEIDCRHNEGIILHYKKTGMDLKESVTKLVTAYLDYIVPVLEKRKISPLIVNVPAPRLDNKSVPEEDMKLKVLIVEQFNLVLSEKLMIKQLPLIDIYGLSGEGKGLANPKYYLDGYHLLPAVYGLALKASGSAS